MGKSAAAMAGEQVNSMAFEVNGRPYRPAARPVVVVCIDGCGDEYLDAAMARGLMPHLAAMARTGHRGLARAAVPTFTNVNNAAIVTGVPPAITGISGNFFLDPQTGQRVMMNDAAWLRCPTILAAAAEAGRRVAVVTAKEKLRDILSKGLRVHPETETHRRDAGATPVLEHTPSAIAFSAEKADQAAAATHGIGGVTELVGQPAPSIYSAQASLFVLQAGVALLQRGLADFVYLSLTDYIQHKHAPGSEEALAFHAQIDRCLGQLLEGDAVVAVTADHGMNAKNRPDGTPNVIYLQTLLEERLGGGMEVVCPITDPYVVHHGALGSLVMVHVDDESRVSEAARFVFDLEGVTEVCDRATAATKLQLPADRIGDLVVMSGRDVALGRREEDHDLTLLEGGLRTHGGRYEEMVPLVVSEPLNDEYAALAEADPRNFDVFAFACNGVRI